MARLSRGEALSISTLAKDEPVTRQAITRHLEVLEDVGLVSGSKVGRERVWELDPERFADAEGALARIREEWSGRLARLKGLVEREGGTG